MSNRCLSTLSLVPAVLGLVAAASRVDGAEVSIIYDKDGSSLEKLAAREIGRYAYLRTGVVASLTADEATRAGDGIVVARKDRPVAASLATEPALKNSVASLRGQEYVLATIEREGRRILLIVGGDDVGTLYGAYRFVETLGVRFYLHGDVVPDRRMAWTIPDLHESGKPLFETRGVLPCHDFPEGPDWWNRDDYLAYYAQVAKLRMNFCGFHSYIEGNGGTEASVWAGVPGDLDAAGNVRFAYPASWANTARPGLWGYAAMRTGDFCGGAAALFAGDDFGPDVMKGLMPRPKTPEECIELFARTGRLFHDAFAEAHALGVKICLGTETPLVLPPALRARLQQQGKKPDDPAVVREVYTGMFRRIMQVCPVDYHWLYTTEWWTWSGDQPGQFDATLKDIEAARGALDSLGNPFTLAINGWVLGPLRDRLALDKVLPKTVPLSCFNRDTGSAPVDPAFAYIVGRPTWAIPWLENDPCLVEPQPWVGRLRYDAADAKRYGCTGVIGIHWRTRILAANAGTLAQAAWDMSWLPATFDMTPVRPKPVSRVPGTPGYAFIADPVQGTADAPVYQRLRYGMVSYWLDVPNGVYTVTLKFIEPNYHVAGKRVFGVGLQDKRVIDKLDIAARVGKNKALDFTFPNIAVTDGWISVDFTGIAESPLIAGIALEGKTADGKRFARKVNIGGPAYKDYEEDPYNKTQGGGGRTMPVEAFYVDLARTQFGDEIGEAAGKIIAKVDGVNFPQQCGWSSGPGSIVLVKTDVKTRYRFVEELAALRPKVKGAGNLDRFDYWLNTYRDMAAMAAVGDARARLNEVMDALKKETDQAKRTGLTVKALDIRIELARAWEKVMMYQLVTTDTPGEMGSIANLEQHNRMTDKILSGRDAEIEKASGKPLPAETQLAATYAGPARIVVPTVRTLVAPGESLSITVMILTPGAGKQNDGTPPATLYWRPLGQGPFAAVPLTHVARRVYRAALPAAPPGATALEYYIATEVGGSKLVWPATAPELNQSVAISEVAGNPCSVPGDANGR